MRDTIPGRWPGSTYYTTPPPNESFLLCSTEHSLKSFYFFSCLCAPVLSITSERKLLRARIMPVEPLCSGPQMVPGPECMLNKCLINEWMLYQKEKRHPLAENRLPTSSRHTATPQDSLFICSSQQLDLVKTAFAFSRLCHLICKPRTSIRFEL